MSQHIARVAARLFAERGYEATAVREIVEASGVTKPTLYYHFGSKEGLAQALLVTPQARLTERSRQVLEAAADPVQAVTALAETLFEFCREDPDRARLMFSVVFGPQGAGLAGEVHKCGCEIDEVRARAVARLAEAGVIDPGRADEFSTALHGHQVIYILEVLYKDRPLGRDVAPRIVRDLLAGFGRAPGDGSDHGG
jgi:AcrR family transcriptional regulator